MLRPDISHLIEFYESSLGNKAGGAIKRILRKNLPEIFESKTLNPKNFMGFGYTSPVLKNFISRSKAMVNIMPGSQGVAHFYDYDGLNLSTIADEGNIPLPDCSINLAIALHALEFADHPVDLLREFWRVLEPGGRLVLIVPNRKSLWALKDNTPFGHGRPYSAAQVKNLLESYFFQVNSLKQALFFPPSNGFLGNFDKFFEVYGRMVFSAAGGVHIVIAEKVMAAPSKSSNRKLVFSPKPVIALNKQMD